MFSWIIWSVSMLSPTTYGRSWKVVEESVVEEGEAIARVINEGALVVCLVRALELMKWVIRES